MLARLRVVLLTLRDSLGHCDPPFWPKFDYTNDPRLAWMDPAVESERGPHAD